MTTAKRTPDVDVAVVGAGPAGLSAARAAAEAGARVICLDGYRRPGGQYYRQPAAGTPTALQRAGAALAERAAEAGAEMRPGTTVWGTTPQRHLELVSGRHRSRLAPLGIVVATGAYERAVPFPGWTLPGVLTAGGVQAMVKQHGVVPGRRVLLAGTGPLLLVVAAALAASGTALAGVLEAGRPGRDVLRHPVAGAVTMAEQGAKLAEAARCAAVLARRRIRPRTGWGIVRAHGEGEVTGATIARLDARARPVPGTERRVECDTVAVHHGLVPAVELSQLLGADLRFAPEFGGHVPVRDPVTMAADLPGTADLPGVFVAGDCAGIGGAGLSLVEGEIAGRAAAAHAAGRDYAAGDVPVSLRRRLARERRFQELYGTLFALRPGLAELPSEDTPVCRCENVTDGDVAQEVARGATTLAAVKSLTRCGMGNCQGRVCEPVVRDRLERHRRESAGDPPRLRARSPLAPLPLSALTEDSAGTERSPR